MDDRKTSAVDTVPGVPAVRRCFACSSQVRERCATVRTFRVLSEASWLPPATGAGSFHGRFRRESENVVSPDSVHEATATSDGEIGRARGGERKKRVERRRTAPFSWGQSLPWNVGLVQRRFVSRKEGPPAGGRRRRRRGTMTETGGEGRRR